MREYLATGKPVVISPLYEYLNTPGVRIYRTTQEFMAAVEDAVAYDTEADRLMRQSAVRNCTWDARAQQVGTLIVELLRARSAGGHRLGEDRHQVQSLSGGQHRLISIESNGP